MDKINKLLDILKDNPSDSFIQHALALEYIKVGNDLAARQVFEELLTRDPGYLGSYYHFAKLLERTNEKDKAIQFYEKGMELAKELGDKQTFSELKSSWEELSF
jgi:Tfp pilus assembly protein PilF